MRYFLTKINKVIKRNIKQFKYRPIRVFCLHQISDEHDQFSCYDCDWIQKSKFESFIKSCQGKYVFISLLEAERKIKSDLFRCRNYAVLTADDGYNSIIDVLPWLEERNIPITLFLNVKYLDGNSLSQHMIDLVESQKGTIDKLDKLYITMPQLSEICKYSNVSIASHGFEHIDATKLGKNEFQQQIAKNIEVLKQYPNFVPFHAYTWGRHNCDTDSVVFANGLTPVLMDGNPNYSDKYFIHRELPQIK